MSLVCSSALEVCFLPMPECCQSTRLTPGKPRLTPGKLRTTCWKAEASTLKAEASTWKAETFVNKCERWAGLLLLYYASMCVLVHPCYITMARACGFQV